MKRRSDKVDPLLERIAARMKAGPSKSAAFRSSCDEVLRGQVHDRNGGGIILMIPVFIMIALVWGVLELIRDDWSAWRRKRRRRKTRRRRPTVQWIEEP